MARVRRIVVYATNKPLSKYAATTRYSTETLAFVGKRIQHTNGVLVSP
jgi:hypothetical protein